MQNELSVVQPSRSTCCAGLWLLLAGLLGAAGVGMGAFEAHELEKMLTGWDLSAEEIDSRLHNCEVAVRYQIYHAVAFLGLAVAAKVFGGRALQVAGACWLLGTILFSGTLYLLVFTSGRSVVHLMIPLGGAMLIIGWVAVAFAAIFAIDCCRKK